MRSIHRIVGVSCAVLLFGVVHSHAQLLGPTPYLSEADSPFAADILGGTVFLETFEDGLLNTPGVAANSGGPLGPGGNADSVDGDDGAIDGSGTNGRSFFSSAIRFTFNEGALGALPTRAGIVWTDGSTPVAFEAFDASGTSLGTLGADHADGRTDGTTAEDRFYGVIHAGGISRIDIRGDPSFTAIEVDHLQYGQLVPEPAALSLLLCGGTASLLRRRRPGSPARKGNQFSAG